METGTDHSVDAMAYQMHVSTYLRIRRELRAQEREARLAAWTLAILLIASIAVACFDLLITPFI
jgi:hypothetical protein